MSTGTVHTKASLILAGGFLLAGGWQYAIGAVVGVLVSPDCDVDSGSIADKFIRKRVGRMVEWMWDTLWYFYRRSIKHGSELSHLPVLGTLGRIAYLYLFLIVVPTLVSDTILPLDMWHEFSWWRSRLMENYRAVLGLMGADLIHFMLDILTTEHAHKSRVAGIPATRTDVSLRRG